MNKYKLTNKEKLHSVILAIIYVTWIVGIHVIMSMSEHQDNYIIYTNLVGSVIALIYAVILNYPLIPLFSRNLNARTEKEAVKTRRGYAIKILYTIIIGFFVCVFLLFLQLDNAENYPYAKGWGVLETAAGVMICVYTIFTIQHLEKMKTLMFVDKLQHKNADIEG